MSLIPTFTGGNGSAPGTFSKKEIWKWVKAGLYLVGSAALVGALNGILQLLGTIDFAHMVIQLPLGIEVGGLQIGTVLTNLVLYAIELVAKDSRK